MKHTLAVISLFLFNFSCQEQPKTSVDKQSVKTSQEIDSTSVKSEVSQEKTKPKTIRYHYQNAKQWLSDYEADSLSQAIAFAVNRTDRFHFLQMDSVLMPHDLSYGVENYLPFPLQVEYIKDIEKIIYFSYPTQTFAAYEAGALIYSGPTNMGREGLETPTGLFFTNWKAKVTTSTVNDEWILHWNFNVLNKEGIGWHEYGLPGYPASHSCLRLQEKDAKYLYSWADQWILADQYTLRAKGTPVIVFGKYDFNAPKPWLKLISDPQALDISKVELQEITEPYLSEILASQTNRDTVVQNIGAMKLVDLKE